MTEPRRKVAIIGFTDSRLRAPYENDDWILAGLNDLYLDTANVKNDRVEWFQVHDGSWWNPDIKPDESPMDFRAGPPHPRDANHLLWLKEWSQKIPIYTLEPHEELPDIKVLDKQAFYDYFDDGYGNAIKYFTNTITWMFGHYIMQFAPMDNDKRALEGAEIGCWGVDMMVAGGPGSEYGWQRPSCEWLLGWARGAGIKVKIPDTSDLLKSAWQYGEKEDEYFRNRVNQYRGEMETRRVAFANQKNQAQLAEAECTGARNAVDWLSRAHMPGDPGEYTKGRIPMPNSHKGQKETHSLPDLPSLDTPSGPNREVEAEIRNLIKGRDIHDVFVDGRQVNKDPVTMVRAHELVQEAADNGNES